MMFKDFQPEGGLFAAFDLLRVERCGALLHVRLNRAAKRNSVSDTLLAQLHAVFVNLPSDVRVAVISGDGDHF